jgi:membrane protein implicated in regulation of membrane protease activity
VIFALCLLIVLLADLNEPWSAAVIITGALLEVGEVKLLLNWSKRLGRRYRPSSPEGELLGQSAKVVSDCRPTGQVKLRGEIWEAVCASGARTGDTVRVDAVDGLTLRVRRTHTLRP